MKQGRATSSGPADQKVEPKSQAINPHSVADIGIKQSYVRSEPMYIGRGIEAPLAGSDTHRSGSQGKH